MPVPGVAFTLRDGRFGSLLALVSGVCATEGAVANADSANAAAHKPEADRGGFTNVILPPAILQSKGAIMGGWAPAENPKRWMYSKEI